MSNTSKPLFSLDEIDRLLIPALLFVGIHAVGITGTYLWFSGYRALSPNSYRSSLNGTDWLRYEVTLDNYTVRETCERCCMNGRVTNGRNQRLGGPAWEHNVQYTIHTTPRIIHRETGRKCTKPKLAARCEPTPCNLPGGVWCFNHSCDGKLLWRHPHAEAVALHEQASSNVFFGPLLVMPAAVLDLYLLLKLVRRLAATAGYHKAHPEQRTAASVSVELSPAHGDGRRPGSPTQSVASQP